MESCACPLLPSASPPSAQLLEVDDALLDAIREGGVVIKGGDDDEAVLCTRDVTYAVKRVDSTNTMWLLRPGEREALVGGREDSVARVAAVANSHLELVEVDASPPCPLDPPTREARFPLERSFFVMRKR